jgi:hypothetical protein
VKQEDIPIKPINDQWDMLEALEEHAFQPGFSGRWRAFLRACSVLLLPGLPPETREWVRAADEFEKGRLSADGLTEVRVRAWCLHDGRRDYARPSELSGLRVAMFRLWPPDRPEDWFEPAWHCLPVCQEAGLRAETTWGLLRCLFGNYLQAAPIISPAILAWNDGTVPKLAQAASDDCDSPDGTLDPARLAILADALEEASVTDTPLLEHLRGPSVHVRGCFVLDAILGKS